MSDFEKKMGIRRGGHGIIGQCSESAVNALVRPDINIDNMRLRPMDEAPRDGTKIIIKHRDEGNRYSVCSWIKPYSTTSNCGAWQYFPGDNSVSHIREQLALGWMIEPRDA